MFAQILKFYDPRFKSTHYGDFENSGKEITKGQKFLVPKQEGTNCAIVEEESQLPILLIASEIEDKHIVTDSHGSFTKDICWKQVN